jgi:hypothetical protein
MNRKRNPEARCGNCAYFSEESEADGYCMRNAVVANIADFKIRSELFCGDHPDFWVEEVQTDE